MLTPPLAGEYMAGLLAERGYRITQTDKQQADLWLLNSCTVKTPAGVCRDFEAQEHEVDLRRDFRAQL